MSGLRDEVEIGGSLSIRGDFNVNLGVARATVEQVHRPGDASPNTRLGIEVRTQGPNLRARVEVDEHGDFVEGDLMMGGSVLGGAGSIWGGVEYSVEHGAALVVTGSGNLVPGSPVSARTSFEVSVPIGTDIGGSTEALVFAT